MLGFTMLGGRFSWRSRCWPWQVTCPEEICAALAGTFPVNTALFAVLLVSVILIVSALTFFPALSLGPILEHLELHAGQLF